LNPIGWVGFVCFGKVLFCKASRQREVFAFPGILFSIGNRAATDNYAYDEIGNLTADAQDGINIEWTVYGKVKTVTKTDGSQTIAYL